MTNRRTFLAGVAATLVAGCSSGGGNGGDGGGNSSATSTSNDSDGDGVVDGEDYAPRDPDVQKRSDLQSDGDGSDGGGTPTATETDDESGGLEKVDEGEDGGGKGGKGGGGGKGGKGDKPGGKGDKPTGKVPEGDPEVIFDRQFSLEASEQRIFRLRIDEPATLEYEFQTVNLPIDAFLLDNLEYENLRQGEEAEMIDAGTTLDTQNDRVVVELEPIDGGHHVLVLDNTNAGEAGPSDNITLEDAVDLRAKVVLYR